jgi:inosine-uridine nucleoside N-ribohydrolase
MPIRALLLILAMLFLLGPLQAAESTADRLRPPTGRIEMVLDSDMFNEVDDQFALAFAARSPERIDLKAVYAAPFLNHRSKSAGDGMEKSCHETLRVLKLMGEKTDGRVFRGSDRFLTDRNTPVDSPAARHLIRLAHQDRKGPLYVVGLGAATNLASALLLDPSIAWLLEPEEMVTSQIVPSPVLTDEGTWKVGGALHPVRVAVKLDRDLIFEVLFQRLSR